MRQLYVFGTGHALVTKLYNSCFAIREQNFFLILDAGGGNGILSAMDAMNVPCDAIRALFVTHTHTDHLLGSVWIIRRIGEAILAGAYSGIFTIYGHDELLSGLQAICKITISQKIQAFFHRQIRFLPVSNGESLTSPIGMLTFFDTGCPTVCQFGCRLQFSDGQTLLYLGDDPIRPCAQSYVRGADWLIGEALCLESERDIHRPDLSFHSTVKETCLNAQRLGVRHLILCHTEDTHGFQREALYLKEGHQFFHGILFVPSDRTILTLA